MKFIVGEDWISILDRLSYRGIIGLAYESTLSGILAYILFGLLCIFAFIGFITVLKWILFGRTQAGQEDGKITPIWGAGTKKDR